MHSAFVWQPGVAPWWMYTWPGVAGSRLLCCVGARAPHSLRLIMVGHPEVEWVPVFDDDTKRLIHVIWIAKLNTTYKAVRRVGNNVSFLYKINLSDHIVMIFDWYVLNAWWSLREHALNVRYSDAIHPFWKKRIQICKTIVICDLCQCTIYNVI